MFKKGWLKKPWILDKERNASAINSNKLEPGNVKN
jgi:hypothetical protein